MLKDQIGVFVLLLLALLAPDRPPPKAPPEPDPPVPNIAGISNWGTIEQEGRSFVILGHAVWSATGRIEPDGKIKITWLMNADGKEAPGEYRIRDDGAIVGKWNYLENVPQSGLWMDDVLKPPFVER